MAFDRQAIKERSRRVLDPFIDLLASLGASPTAVSLAGLAVAVWAAVVIAKGYFVWGGVLVVVSGLCDVLDGGLARRQGRQTQFGAFIDSTLDRIGELVVYGGILIFYAGHGYPLIVVGLVCAAMGASFMVSYARARIEGLGYRCTVGMLERPERMVLLIAGLLLGPRILAAVLFLVAFGAALTVLQRIQHAHDLTQGPPPSV